MIRQRCECGALYKFPDAALGKKAKCKKCGAVMTLEGDDDAELYPLAEDPITDLEPPPPPPTPVHATADSLQDDLDSPYPPEQPSAGYSSSIIGTFLFPSSVHNLIDLGTVTIILVVGSWIPFFGFVVAGWFAAYRFSVIQSAAAGDDDLPGVTFWNGFFDDIIVPLLKWTGSWIVVMLPAVVYAGFAATTGAGTALDRIFDFFGGLGSAIAGSGGDITLTVLIYGGLFLWPMIVLCVALGGLSAVYRIDLIVTTILRSFGPYLLTVAIVTGAQLLDQFLADLVRDRVAARSGSTIGGALSGGILIEIVTTGITVYFEIVAMRAIGLYYHHFKHRFAWNWG